MKVKMLILALVALGLTAPATASATAKKWYDDEFKTSPTEAKPKVVSPHGNLTITEGTTQYGPCTFNFEGEIWNKTSGEGVIKLATPVAPCPTNTFFCTIEATTVAPIGLTLMTNTNLKFSGLSIQMHLSPLCTPSTRTVSGTVEGLFDLAYTNAEKKWVKTKFTFKNTPGLTIEGKAATLDGEIEFGTQLTAVT